MPEIDLVDWNVEEFRRLLNEPLRLTSDFVTYDATSSDVGESATTEIESVKEESAEARHPNSNDHRLYSLPEGDALLQTKAGGDELLSPVATGDEAGGDSSTIIPHSQIEPSVEPELASPQANEGQPIENARPVLVVNIEMALAARVDAVNAWVPADRPEEITAQPSLIDIESITVVEAPLEANSQEVHAPLGNDGPDVYPDNQLMLGDVPGACLSASETTYLPPSASVASSTAPARNVVADQSSMPSDTLLQKSSEAYQADLGGHIAGAGDAEANLVLPEAREAFQVPMSVLNSETKPAIGVIPASNHFDPPEIYPAESILAISAPTYAVSSISAREVGADSIAGGDFPSSPEAGDDASELVSPGPDGLDSRDHPFARWTNCLTGEELTEVLTAPLSTAAVLPLIETNIPDRLRVLFDQEVAKAVVQDPPIMEAIGSPTSRSNQTSAAMESVDAKLALAQPEPVDTMSGGGIKHPLKADESSEPKDLTWLSQSSLHKAVFKEDVWAAPADRERAIVLRWALRDIRAKRVGLFPLDQHVFQMLLDMGLVELSDGQLILTQAGSAAIASSRSREIVVSPNDFS
ncbi:hypothetical protein [Bradyrhizobium sp. URHA0013]|uniref:hypothetical protein n=1 Tax=Bradyrhizobium sp. URHA0013 TaxID=1380352 RepID=UPI0004B4D461|nr:hypothetical protein [Bradyrhizobium sp. URHA0013]